MKRIFISILLLLLALPALAATPKSFLPEQLDGWQRQSDKTSNDAAAADPANLDLLKEYGFTGSEQATYTQPGRTLEIHAARFGDVSGAYGAFTFYRTPDMVQEKIGDRAASEGMRVLFQKNNVLVTATFSRVSVMSAAELRDLAQVLPVPGGSLSMPTVEQYLPTQGFVAGSAKYVLGPVGLQSVQAPLPARVVGFESGAEVALGKYATTQGTATVIVISYPTPQIAAQRLRDVVAYLQSNAAAGAARNDQFAKRSGPMVAVVTGDVSQGEARSLLASINYDADVTWNQRTSWDKRENVANLLVNVIYLIGILFLFALVLGIFFGGARVILKRMFPDKVFDRPEDVEIIRLNLRE